MSRHSPFQTLGRGPSEAHTAAGEVPPFSPILIQRFAPTHFDKGDRTPAGEIAGVNLQDLPFHRSDIEQESHSAWSIVDHRTKPLFEYHAIGIGGGTIKL